MVSEQIQVCYISSFHQTCRQEVHPAKLHQAHRVHAVSPEELVQLLRKAAIEVRKPRPEIRCCVPRCHVDNRLIIIFFSSKCVSAVCTEPLRNTLYTTPCGTWKTSAFSHTCTPTQTKHLNNFKICSVPQQILSLFFIPVRWCGQSTEREH